MGRRWKAVLYWHWQQRRVIRIRVRWRRQVFAASGVSGTAATAAADGAADAARAADMGGWTDILWVYVL